MGALGCELGSLAGELSDLDDEARRALAQHFTAWETILAAALTRIWDKGVLSPHADPARLATGIITALTGGYLLAQVSRSSLPMEIALHLALDRVRAFAAPSSR